ncbi:MAG: hypothetical protein JJU05_19250, partial [Verrucomicrobia bacterium]|nr:hypothetical protein [Verrucomicrobiota bacterium]
ISAHFVSWISAHFVSWISAHFVSWIRDNREASSLDKGYAPSARIWESGGFAADMGYGICARCAGWIGGSSSLREGLPLVYYLKDRLIDFS